MCKYCKRLKELNDLEKKSLQKSIDAWKRRDLVARKIISMLCEFAEEFGNDTSHASIEELMDCGRVLSQADEFVKCNWIGK